MAGSAAGTLLSALTILRDCVELYASDAPPHVTWGLNASDHPSGKRRRRFALTSGRASCDLGGMEPKRVFVRVGLLKYTIAEGSFVYLDVTKPHLGAIKCMHKGRWLAVKPDGETCSTFASRKAAVEWLVTL